MFTGLIQHLGTVVRRIESPAGARLVVDAQSWAYRPSPGDSIAVNGCCLTAVEAGEDAGGLGTGIFAFDVITQTLENTTLGGLCAGDTVNLEHATRADTLMGGHVVQGHIDAIGTVARVQADPNDWRVEIAVGAEVLPMLAPRGSVTVEGVSLTIAAVDVAASSFTIALIPTTLRETTLDALKVGQRLNLETDILARQVVHAVRLMMPGLGGGVKSAW